MPVRFLLGPAGSGKTHRCLQELRRLERAGRAGVYLVPEQFTYSADRELLSDSSLPGLRRVQVLSFSRLGHRLREEAGEPGPRAVSDAVRAMLLRAVLSRLEPAGLGALAALRGRQGLLDALGRFIAEVRAHGPVAFQEAARRALADLPAPAASTRLEALAAIFAAYDGALRDLGRADPEESLSGLEARIVERREEIRNWAVFVDGFLSWTRREREILVALAAAGAHLEIALCLDAEPRAPFEPAERSRAQLCAAFARAGVVEEEPLRLAAPAPEIGRFRSSDLWRLERRLYAEEPGEGRTGSGDQSAAGVEVEGGARKEPAVVLQAARTPRQEVLLWARTLDRWLRLDPVPCAPEETAVILRTLDPYRDFIREIFPRYGLPVFVDERRGLLAHPRVRFFLDALEVILSGWRRDAVIAFLRNPLLAVPAAELDLLDFLSREYGRDFEAWYAPEWEPHDPGRRVRVRRPAEEECAGEDSEREDGEWDLDGDQAEEEIEEDEVPPAGDEDADGQRRREALRLSDRLRARTLLPLRALEESWRRRAPTGAELVDGLRELARGLLAPEAARDPDPEPEWTAQVERELESLLGESAGLWEGVAVDPEEFARALRQGCASARVGVTPQRLGQVTVAEIQRSRLHGIRRAVVGGCNDGILPRTVGEDSILSDRDRRALGAVGLEFGPTAEERQQEEVYFAYIALTRASERLLLTWSRTGEQGETLEPSLLLEEVRRALPEAEVAAPGIDPESLEPAALQTGAELGARLVVHLAETGVDADREAAAADPLLEELYNRVELEGGLRSGDGAPVASAAAVTSAAGAAAAPAPGPIHLGPPESPLDEARRRLDRARPALLYDPPCLLDEEVLARLFPDGTIRAGVSRLIEYARCPYQEFARRALRLEPRPSAEVTPLETGTLAHLALERFFRWEPVVDPALIRRRLEEVFRSLESREEFRAFFVDEGSRYRWRSTLRNLERFLRVEMARLAASPYQPHAQEVAFGPAWGNAVEIPLERGRLFLLGRIDRLDRREAEGAGGESLTLATVIDYKRAPKTGVPRGLERGVDLQLAAYLLFVRETLGWIPAGGFYAPVLVSPRREEDVAAESANPLQVQVHGIYLREEGPSIDAGSRMLAGLKGKSDQAIDRGEMERALQRGKRFLAAYAGGIRSGWIEARPLEERPGALPCATCDFGPVCRFRRGRDPVRRDPVEGLALPPDPGDPS